MTAQGFAYGFPYYHSCFATIFVTGNKKGLPKDRNRCNPRFSILCASITSSEPIIFLKECGNSVQGDSATLQNHFFIVYRRAIAKIRLKNQLKGLMFATSINPHRLCLSCFLKAHFLIKLDCIGIRGKHLHVEVLVSLLQAIHNKFTDSFALVTWQN